MFHDVLFVQDAIIRYEKEKYEEGNCFIFYRNLLCKVLNEIFHLQTKIMLLYLGVFSTCHEKIVLLSVLRKTKLILIVI